MMKCPRCGFTQPRDQYCAQCGLDISTYKPPQRPLFDRLVQSPLVQLGFVAVLIFSVSTYVIRKKDRALTERVNYLKGNLQISSQKPASPPATSPTNLPAPANPTESANVKGFASPESLQSIKSKTLPPTTPSSPTTSAATTASLTKTAGRSAEGTTENKTQHTVKISYYEIFPRVRDLLYDESRSTGQFNSYGDYVAGLLNQFHRRLPTLGKEAVLLHSEVKAVENENPAHWFTGLESSNTENHIGFYNNLQLVELDPNSFRLNFEIIKSWKENIDGTNTALVKSSYPLQIEMLKSSACFILGVLSPPTTAEGEDYISSVPPFTVLKSANFRQRRTQFLIILEIEK